MQAEAAFSPPGMVLDELSSDRLPEMRKSRMVPASFFATAASGILQTSSDRNVPGFDEVVLGCGLRVLVSLDAHRSTLSCAPPTEEA